MPVHRRVHAPGSQVSVGTVTMTQGACDALEKAGSDSHDNQVSRLMRDSLARSLMDRHIRCDWGDISESDRDANDQAQIHGGERIVSAYTLPGQIRQTIWIITEADRSVTTLLLPEEY